ncbi:hypothetical protein EDB86DRAFT_1634653 [Lactarius hatsudake]|nr:hypothetical protein EDB86DRAFT_1634653 [Lactarius hatsudake]
MSFLLMDAQGPDSTSTSVVLSPQDACTIGFVCRRLLQILDSEANAAQDFAISMTYPQPNLVRFACYQLLRELGQPDNVLNAPQLGENQVLATYPQVTLTIPQLKFVWDTYVQLLVYGPFGESTTLLASQVLRYFAISQIYQLLQMYGVLPDEPGERQVLADNVPYTQLPAPDTAQPMDAQEATVPADSGSSSKLLCPVEGCQATFGRQQELKRHAIDVHTLPHRCPFCPYGWSRPDKIKAHLKAKHQDEPQVLNEILPKRGQHLVTYLLATFPEVVQNIQ